MVAYNIVRFRVKPGMEDEFLSKQREAIGLPMKGFVSGGLVSAGDRNYFFVGAWENFERIVEARPLMIGALDKVRHTLEDLGGGLGVTDPHSGELVIPVPAGA